MVDFITLHGITFLMRWQRNNNSCVLHRIAIYMSFLSVWINGTVVQYAASHFRCNFGCTESNQVAMKIGFYKWHIAFGVCLHLFNTQPKGIRYQKIFGAQRFSHRSSFLSVGLITYKAATQSTMCARVCVCASVACCMGWMACFFNIEHIFCAHSHTINSRCKFFILFHFKSKGNKEKEENKRSVLLFLTLLFSCWVLRLCAVCTMYSNKETVRFEINGRMSI